MIRDLDALRQGSQVIPPIAAPLEPDPATGFGGEALDHIRRDPLKRCPVQHGLHALSIGAGLIPNRPEAIEAVFQRRVIQIGHARLNRVVEAFEAQLRVSRAHVQFGQMLAPPLGPLLPPVKDAGKQVLQPLGVQQAIRDMTGDKAIQLVHRDRTALAAGFALPGLDRAAIVAIAAVLASAQRHGSATVAAEANAGEQGRAGYDARRQNLRVPGLQELLHRLEGLGVDDRRNRNRDDFTFGVMLPALALPVELMFAHVGAAGQDAVELADAPAATVAREDALAVEVVDDGLHPHRAGRPVPLQRQPIDQANGVGVQRVNLQLLLDLRAALLGRDDAVADGRQSAVPEALPRVLLQRAQDVLGVFLGLIFIEQRHDLPHHLVNGIVADLLRDRNELHPVLRQLADVELHLEVIAEEPGEAVNHDNIEGRGLGRACLDHALELRAAVIGGRCSGFHICLDKLVAARGAIDLALLALVGNRNVMLGLPGGGDAQVKGGAGRDIRTVDVHRWPPAARMGSRCSTNGNASSTRSCTTFGMSFLP